MVNTCVVWGCTNRAGVVDSTSKFYDIPKVITHQGKQMEELSSERRVLWLSQINRANFNPDPNKRHFKVCSDHFISGMNICIFNKTASYVCYRYIFVNSHLKIIVHVDVNCLHTMNEVYCEIPHYSRLKGSLSIFSPVNQIYYTKLSKTVV